LIDIGEGLLIQGLHFELIVIYPTLAVTQLLLDLRILDDCTVIEREGIKELDELVATLAEIDS
jgi:hypothetical protein